ncbi:ABC transporter substrate-binding protein [Bartonella sp. LJL80]
MTLKSTFLTTGIFAICLPFTQAAAQQKTLYVGMNGGNFERAFSEYVFPPFEKENNVRIVVVPGTSADIMAKAVAAKDNPQMHLIFLDDGVMNRAISAGLCQPIDDAPVLKQLAPAAIMKDRMAIGIDMGMTGLGYNKKMFAEQHWPAPTSWIDLADPKFKGKVVFQSASVSSFGLHAFLMFNRIEGGDENNVEPGFKAFPEKIAPNVIEYIPNSAKISEMVQTNEAAIFPLTPTGAANFQEKGIDVGYAQPKEGSVLLMVAECAIARNSEPELTQKLAHYILSPEAQSLALAHGNVLPSNQTVHATTAQAEDHLQKFNDYLKNTVILNWDAINAKRPEWNNRWNRRIER